MEEPSEMVEIGGGMMSGEWKRMGGGGDLAGRRQDHIFIGQKCLASAGLGTGRTR